MAAVSSCANGLVACNVYVSAGRPRHRRILLDILSRSQERCRYLRLKGKERMNSPKAEAAASIHTNEVVLVHAFADGPYDRSSFHLAGRSESVADVATLIAQTALESLSSATKLAEIDVKGEVSESNPTHPFVGLVDHISVMPLLCSNGLVSSEQQQTQQKIYDRGSGFIQYPFIPPDPAGKAALAIGQAMSKIGVKTFFYGSADPDSTPLATVRRERTSFFRSTGSGTSENKRDEAVKSALGAATVGSPSTFVENFNVRLSHQCSKRVAISLAKALRERDGGLPGVEALTLPYSEGRFEVACNLLRPDVGSVSALLLRLESWVSQQQRDQLDKADLVDDAYRVGTTSKQCRDILIEASIDAHENEVVERFKTFIERGGC
mmetsp:Transcript_27424/g.80662  ORF Transcript_27424/g.80662 Transcript_27424/m.80662 type:complete len:380 (-) Transcript_27424:294-1433(-)